MSIIDIEQSTYTPVRKACDNIRQNLDAVLCHAETSLHRIRNIVHTHGRKAIATELGTDDAALLSVYNSLKDAVEIGKAVVVKDIPE